MIFIIRFPAFYHYFISDKVLILFTKLRVMIEHRITTEIIRGKLNPRAKEAHKGDFGHALIIAGVKGKLDQPFWHQKHV